MSKDDEGSSGVTTATTTLASLTGGDGSSSDGATTLLPDLLSSSPEPLPEEPLLFLQTDSSASHRGGFRMGSPPHHLSP
ncbi:hypothetical protein SK128_013798, partial [Halocaridina rubra]